MDLKFTKKRISEHITYDWTKYIALIVACFFAVSLFFNIFARRLTDREELKIVFFGNTIHELEDTYLDYMSENSSLYDTEYVDTIVEYYATEDDFYTQKAAVTKIEAELVGSGMGADIVVLPIVKGLLDENGTWIDNDGNIVGGSYFDKNGEFKDFAPYSFNYRVGRNYFIPIDEVLESEIAKGNPEAVKLQEKLAKNNYYYNCQRIAANDETPNKPFDTPIGINNKPLIVEYGQTIDKTKISTIQRGNFGIDLNTLNLSKTTKLINDGILSATQFQECNYVLGIRRDSNSHADAISFINWFVDTYSK